MTPNLESRAKLISRYGEALHLVQGHLSKRRLLKSSDALKQWKLQLSSDLSDSDLLQHARRPMRALGGMESIGEIALADNDRTFLDSVESLYAVAKLIAALCCSADDG
jgi:hypothetical protein